MRAPRLWSGALLALSALIWLGCSDQGPDSVTGPAAQLGAGRGPDVRAAIAAQERHTPGLMRISGVVGTAVGLGPDGRAVVRIFLEWPGVRGLPANLDGIPVSIEVTGRFMALSDPTKRLRPAPLGYSVGHPAITAGTIGFRGRDQAGNVFLVSNNHVLANSNDANIGDPELQPGPFDGGTSADQIATLYAFRPIDFSGGPNTIDAAMAQTTTAETGNATPTDDGYGAPASTIFGDANGDGRFDDIAALLGLNVQKFGRTTKLTHGQITGINATVTICYEVLFIFCVKSAQFVDQLIIEPGAFSGGGDSGSLIATDDANRNPVALLFAGSSTQTIANRIDLVLSYFGVTVDGGDAPPPPPPTPLTDLAIAGVSAPGSVEQGATAQVTVTVRNVGNQDVGAVFDVTLRDATDNVTIGTQSVAGLAAGATASRTFSWNTTASSTGGHLLLATHNFADENGLNDSATVSVTVNAPGTGTDIHVGDLDGTASDDGTTWSAMVEITVHDASHNPVDGATVLGQWNRSGLNANECTTGELGGNGTCIVLFPSLRRGVKSVSFRVISVTMPGRAYVEGANHDVDGSSNGTLVTVNRP